MTDNPNDKREIRDGAVREQAKSKGEKATFERISTPEDAARYNYDETPAGTPSVSPSEEEPALIEEEVHDEETPAEVEKVVTVEPEPEPTAPAPKMQIPELDSQVMQEAKAELREVAQEVAAEKYVPKEPVVDTLEKALLDGSIKGVKWGIIGAGQAGGRLAEQFYKFGYPACVVNTAKQDMTLLELPESNKLFLDYALGGAGKEMTIGEAALLEYQDDVISLMRSTFGQDVETVVICVGGGGGTGSGSVYNLVKMVARFGLPVTVLYTLPLNSEGSITKANSIRALDLVARLTAGDEVNALVIVDNSKIEQIYPNVSAAQFWQVANFDIVNTLNMFNTLCRCDTKYDSLDPMDFVRIFSVGNCSIYGKIEIPVEIEGGQVLMYEDELANQVLATLQSGLLADGFDLKETVAGGIIITGPEEILDQIPAVNINYMYHRLNELIGDANIYRGLYRDDDPRPRLTVYTILSGLGLPAQRVEKLLHEAQNAVDSIESKKADKSKMVVDTNQQSTNQEQDIYKKMKQGGTAFGRLSQRRGKRRGPGRG